MRSFRTLAALVAASTLLTMAGLPSSASAQRHGPRRHALRPAPAAAPAPMLTPRSAADECAAVDCEDDYTLTVVHAIMPVSGGDSYGPMVLSLVLENRGSARSPASMVAVAPRDHVSLVSRSGIPSLAPGERVTVQVPVQVAADDGCVSITITPGQLPSAFAPRQLAMADPDPVGFESLFGAL